LKEHRNCLITGPTGAGKAYLACAVGTQACREGYGSMVFLVKRLVLKNANTPNPHTNSAMLDGSGTSTKLACQPLFSVSVLLDESSRTVAACIVNISEAVSVLSGMIDVVILVFVTKSPEPP